MRLLHRVRSAVVVGLLWAVPWALAGLVASPLLITMSRARISPLDALLMSGLIGWYGFLAGLTFSFVLVVVVAARRRTLRELTPLRMLAWGATSSVVLTAPPMLHMLAGRPDGWRTEDPVWLGGSLLLSGGCALASLLIAQRADALERAPFDDASADVERGDGRMIPLFSAAALREHGGPPGGGGARAPVVPVRRPARD